MHLIIMYFFIPQHLSRCKGGLGIHILSAIYKPKGKISNSDNYREMWLNIFLIKYIKKRYGPPLFLGSFYAHKGG